MPTRIFVADNNPEFLGARCTLLEAAGFDVIPCTSAADSDDYLRDHWVHLAVIDKRLTDDANEDDISGIELCAAIDPIVPKIIITAHPFEGADVVKAMRLDVADFVAVKDGPRALLGAIERTLGRRAVINHNLAIEYAGTTFAGLASIVDRAPVGDARLPERAMELEDLFRKIFADCHEISLGQLFPGHRDTALVVVRRATATGELSPVIVKCGPRATILRERDNHAAFVKDLVGPFSAQLTDCQETLHFAGIVYRTVGVSLDDTEPFADFYRRQPVAAESHAVDRIFTVSCHAWYQHGVRPSDAPLDAIYRRELGLDRPEVEAGVARWIDAVVAGAGRLGCVAITPDGDAIRFHISGALDVRLPSPMAFVAGGGTGLAAGSPLGVTHGDLNGHNVLLDRDGRAWLIDFERTGWGPALRDFAELESVIRLELIESRNFERIFAFERALLDPAALDGFAAPTLPSGAPDDLAKAAAVIAPLRAHAADLVVGADARHYAAGLFFCALRMIALGSLTAPGQSRPSLTRRAHALLSASMLAHRLAHWDAWPGWPDGTGGSRTRAEVEEAPDALSDRGAA